MEKTMKKIVFFTGSMGRGGAERVISLLSADYVNRGWQVSIAMVLHDVVNYQLDERVNVVKLASDKGIKKGFSETLKNIKKYLKAEKPDVIVVFMAQICLLVGLANKGLKIPMICSERIDPSQVKRNFVYKFLLNRTYKKCSKVVFQTERAKNYFNKKIQKNSCIIGNPINVACERIPNESHVVVSAGRMTTQKNQKMLIEAFSEVNKKYPEYKLIIYGEGELRKDLENKIDELNIKSNVSLPGNVPDIHEQIKNAEIFVLSSDFEGLSNALMEAMLMGFPVISTDCAGSDEIIQNKSNGLIIPVGDKQALIGSLTELIENKELKETLSVNAKKSMEKYKVDNIIETWRNVIDEEVE